jgi:hypothetical protein
MEARAKAQELKYPEKKLFFDAIIESNLPFIEEYISKHGQEVVTDLFDSDGATPILIACKKCQKPSPVLCQLVDFFLSHGATINDIDRDEVNLRHGNVICYAIWGIHHYSCLIAINR